MNFKTFVIIFLSMVVLFAGIFIYTNYQHRKVEQALRDEIQRQNHLIIEDSTLYSKLAEEKNSIAAENKDLKVLLKVRDEKIQSLTQLTLTQDSIIFALQQGTVIPDTGNTGRIIMSAYHKPYNINGYALYPSGKWSLGIVRDPILLAVYYTQTKFGAINRVYVDTQDSTLKVSDVKFYKAKEKKSIFQTLEFNLGVEYSKKFGPGLMGGFGLKRNKIGAFLFQDSYGFYYLRSF